MTRSTIAPLLCAALSLGATCRRGADGPAADVGTVPDPDAGPAVPAAPPGEGEGTSHDFPVMPGMAHACGESILSADGTEILWDMFATTEPVETVAAWYEARLGADGMQKADGEWTWRMPPGAERPERVLTIGPASAWHPDCPGLPADAVTIGNFSNMFTRN